MHVVHVHMYAHARTRAHAQVSQSGPYERVTLIIDVAEQPCVRYVEISPRCTGWSDPLCVTDFEVDEDEWRARL